MRRILVCMTLMAAALSPAHALDRLVTVTGEATIAVPPDTAMIRIGVTSLGKSAREASDANAQKMQAVLSAIRSGGIADKAVQTSRLSLQPQYETGKGGPARLLGFQVTNQLTVKIHDIGTMPNVLDKAIGAGANEMSGIEFIVSEQSKLLAQARDEAIADARRKAELYVKAAGGRLGPVVSLAEEGAPSPPRPIAAMRAASVPIAPGEQTLRAAVSYELAQ